MPENAIPTQEFSHEQKAALALAGTVALPSPFPASARILIGIMPQPDATIPRRYYLKIVEFIDDTCNVTRLVNLDDLRAVRLVPESGLVEDLSAWTLLTAEDLYPTLERAKDSLKQAASTTFRAFELPLFPDDSGNGESGPPVPNGPDAPPDRKGVVYVPETAPHVDAHGNRRAGRLGRRVCHLPPRAFQSPTKILLPERTCTLAKAYVLISWHRGERPCGRTWTWFS